MVDDGERLQRLRDRVYGPGADAADVQRYRDALGTRPAEAPATVATVEPDPAVEPEPAPEPAVILPRRSRRVAVGLVLLAAGVLAGVLIGAVAASSGSSPSPAIAPPSTQQSVQRRVLESAGSLTALDYYRLWPDDLPLEWGGASTGTAFRRLGDGRTVSLRPAAVSRSLLVVVVCASVDRRVSWRMSAIGSDVVLRGTAPCGGFAAPDPTALPAALRGRQLALTVTTPGAVPFSAAVLER